MSLKLGTTDISGVPTTLINTVNNKLDASTYTSNPRTNAVYITQTYHSGASWYRVWSDGFIEQGGTTPTLPTSDSYTVSLIKNMTSTNYYVKAQRIGTITGTTNTNSKGVARWSGNIVSLSTSNFVMQSDATPFCWYACGY